MKHSINKIFNNLIMILTLITMISFFLGLAIYGQNSSSSKINNLNMQKSILSSLTKLNKEDVELAIIQLNGKSTQLHYEIEKLKAVYQYDYLGQYFLNNSNEYLADLNELSLLTSSFNQKASLYYTKESENEDIKKQELQKSYSYLANHINSLLLKELSYNQKKFYLFEKVAILLFALLLVVTIWYRKRLQLIYNDILFLYAVENNKKGNGVFSEEIDAISLRMKRKPVISDNPAMIDTVTDINNNKGLMHSYAEKKGMKDSNFTSVTVFEVDNFSKSNRVFSQDFTQAILKKIAFTMTLHEQATDVIARTDYNQFTLVFSRASKEQLFKDMEIIRQSISELKFRTPEKESVQITVTGGLVIKPNNTNLEESIRQAKEVLEHAKSTGRNKISQLSDVAHKHF